MPFTIAVAGKGGTGKTTFATLIVNYLKQKKVSPILAVDADPNANFGDFLGMKWEKAISDILDETKGLRSAPPGMSKIDYLEYGIEQTLVETKDLDLLVMGRPEGPGCYCAANSMLSDYLDRLKKNYSHVVIDNEAGMEHLSRKTTWDIELLFLISDHSVLGIRSAARIKKLCQALSTPVKEIYLVTNFVNGEVLSKVKEEIKLQRLDSIGIVPCDLQIQEFSLEEKSLFNLPPDSPSVKAVEEIMSKVNLEC